MNTHTHTNNGRGGVGPLREKVSRRVNKWRKVLRTTCVIKVAITHICAYNNYIHSQVYTWMHGWKSSIFSPLRLAVWKLINDKKKSYEMLWLITRSCSHLLPVISCFLSLWTLVFAPFDTLFTCNFAFVLYLIPASQKNNAFQMRAGVCFNV